MTLEDDLKRRVTDSLELSEPQKAFLNRVCADVGFAVKAAVEEHEHDTPHICQEAVEEVVKMTLAAGDFKLPNGQSPRGLLEDHSELKNGQVRIERDMGKVLDVVVGPVETDWAGVPDPDGMRDESQGLMAQTDVAMRAVKKLDDHLSNGGVPVKLPTSIKVAIWGAAATVSAATITAGALIVSAILT